MDRNKGREAYLGKLQAQYSVDAVAKAEKQKQKDQEKRLENIARMQRMGYGLGEKLGTAAAAAGDPSQQPQPIRTASTASDKLAEAELRRYQAVQRFQADYDRARVD